MLHLHYTLIDANEPRVDLVGSAASVMHVYAVISTVMQDRLLVCEVTDMDGTIIRTLKLPMAHPTSKPTCSKTIVIDGIEYEIGGCRA